MTPFVDENSYQQHPKDINTNMDTQICYHHGINHKRHSFLSNFAGVHSYKHGVLSNIFLVLTITWLMLINDATSGKFNFRFELIEK